MKTLHVLSRCKGCNTSVMPQDKRWFQIETEGEAARESDAMNHAVEKHFRQAVRQQSNLPVKLQHLH